MLQSGKVVQFDDGANGFETVSRCGVLNIKIVAG